MQQKTLVARLPALPSPDFFLDPSHSIRTSDTGALLIYDPETRAGLVYSIDVGTWAITAPIDFYSFVVLAAASGHRVPETDEARAWFDACDAGADDARRGMN
jgi:hypothetical protein